MSPNPSTRGLAIRAGSAALLLSLASACTSSFFKLDPEGNGAAASPRAPAPAPDAPPDLKPDPRPVAKPEAPSPVRPPDRRAARPRATAAVERVEALTTPPERAPAPPVAPLLDPDPEAAASDSAGVARLVRLAMVWHTAALHHPAIAAQQDAWDGTIVRNVAAVRAATDDGRLRAAYARMLDVLNDPLTRMERDAGTAAPVPGTATASTLPDGTVLLALPPSSDYGAPDSAAVARVIAARAPRIVIDLRGTTESAVAGGSTVVRAVNDFTAATGLVEAMISSPLALPALRVRRSGSQGDVAVSLTRNGTLIRPTRQESGWLEIRGRTLVPAALRAPQIVVIANPASVIPAAIAALVSDRRALLVAEERVTDESLVPNVRVAVRPDMFARVRTGELVHADGTTGIHADTVVPRLVAAGDSAPALRAALSIVRRASPGQRSAVRSPFARAMFPQGSVALANDTVPYPYMGARLLAGFRVWSVMRARHAHRESYDDDIGALFERTIPLLEAARNRQQYAAALRNLVVSFDDSQVELRGPSRDALRPPALAPFRVRQIEGRAIVTAIDASGAPPTGVPTPKPALAVGTEIISADGFPLAAWLLEHRRDVVASNDWTRARDLMALMPRGREGDALLRVRDAAGPERAVGLPRTLIPSPASTHAMGERVAAAVASLGADISYLDLDRLDDAAATAAITNAAENRAIVLDLRGRSPAAATVLRRLVVNPEFVMARVVQRALSSPCTVASPRDAARVCADERVSTPVVLRLDTAGHYRGRVVALIDERTQGAAEQLALALEAGANATLIGSSSAGAAADTVSIPLPGGLWLSYPADEIRRADGGQLHRTGITPIVEARQTVRGVRGGKDDVIERAAAWLQQGFDSPRRRR